MASLLLEALRFERDCDRIDALVGCAIGSKIADQVKYRTYIEFAIIQLHDAWARSCRSIICKSSLGSIITATNVRLKRSPSLCRSDRVVDWLQQKWTSKKRMAATWEPDWHVPSQAIRAAALLKITNEATVAAALGASLEADHVRLTRNVVAHTLPATWSRLRAYQRQLGFTGREPIADFVLSRPKPTGPAIIDVWISDLKACIRAAVA